MVLAGDFDLPGDVLHTDHARGDDGAEPFNLEQLRAINMAASEQMARAAQGISLATLDSRDLTLIAFTVILLVVSLINAAQMRIIER
jgi:hypothetical protein